MTNSGEIKQIARNKLAGNWGKAIAISAIYIAIVYALSYCSTLIENVTLNTPILNDAAKIIFTIILLPLSFGFISTMIKLLNGKNPAYTTVINDSILNASKAVGIFFRTLLKILFPAIIVILAAVAIVYLTTQYFPVSWDTLFGYLLFLAFLYVVCGIIIAIVSLPYSLATYALANNNELTSKEAIDQSVSLMEGNKWNFVKLMLSFIGWFILIALAVGIITNYAPSMFEDLTEAVASILILPYIIASISVFYDELNDVKVEFVKTEEQDEVKEETPAEEKTEE